MKPECRLFGILTVYFGPRFFQLRGIGEVEQYQGAPNPSVGFLIDDIDFSGVGMPATLFDTHQVEVLRGPQGTTYRANALAGLISVRTNDPGSDFELNSELTGANYDTRSAGIVMGDGFASGAAGWRLVAQQYVSNGFRHNAYLDENSTNRYDEGEPLRDSRRLHQLRGWSNGNNINQVFDGSQGACGADGIGAPARVFIAVGGNLGCY